MNLTPEDLSVLGSVRGCLCSLTYLGSSKTEPKFHFPIILSMIYFSIHQRTGGLLYHPAPWTLAIQTLESKEIQYPCASETQVLSCLGFFNNLA